MEHRLLSCMLAVLVYGTYDLPGAHGSRHFVSSILTFSTISQTSETLRLW